MKRMADDLCDLDEHVEDSTLVPQILRGLNKKYDHVKTFLKQTWSLPPSTMSATTFSRSSLWTLRPHRAQPPLSLPQVDNSNDLDPTLSISVDPRPPLLPSAVIAL
jgi:hypothetical protein